MIMDNENLLQIIDTALKDTGIIEINTLGESILQPAKFDTFIRTVQDKTKILPEARYMRMESQIVDIDRIAFIGRVFDSLMGETLGTADKIERLLNSATEYAKPQFSTNQLIAVGLQAIVSIKDSAMRRNIEKGNLENTILTLLGEAGGRDLEELALLGNKDIPYATDRVLRKTDGWIEKAVNKIYGVNGEGTTKDFDPAAATYPENMFEAALSAIPKVYLNTLSEWRFWVTWAVENSYRKILKARGTPLGDSVSTQAQPLAFEGIPVVRVPILERSATYSAVTHTAGKVCLFGHPDNMVWGVFFEMTLEREREAKLHQTDFVATCEVDANYEDENAAVAIYIDRPKPAEEVS